MAENLHSSGFEVLYVGTSRGMEAKLVPEKGFAFFTVKTGALKNQNPLKMIRSVFSLCQGILWAMGFIHKHKPKAVIGVGGYVSAPAVIAGYLLGVPIYLQEQNASVGIANQLLGKLATRVFLGFAGATASFGEKKCLVTGNPLRTSFTQFKPKASTPTQQRLLILGGSQGARAINQAICENLGAIESNFPNIEITHQTGRHDIDWVKEQYQKNATRKHQVVPFIENMPDAYSEATLVIARSGAMTISELCHMRRPAIFVPYPRRGQNDQTANADFLKQLGAAQVVLQGEEFSQRLLQSILTCFEPKKLAQMEQGFPFSGAKDATSIITQQLIADLAHK